MKNKLNRIASHAPGDVAYICGEDRLTYGTLWTEATLAAERLKKQGSSPVLIYGHKEKEVIISILACLISGRTYVPVDTGTPLIRIGHILSATRSTLILSNTPLSGFEVDCCSLEELGQYDPFSPMEVDCDIAYIIFTSGSTGEPKGVPIPRSNLSHFIDWISALPPLNEYQKISVLNQAGFNFDLSVADLYYALINGHTLVALPKQTDDIFPVVKEHRVHVAVMTPTYMKLCLLDKEFNEVNLPHFSCVYFCGEPLEKQTVRKLFAAFPNIRIINAYGPTEATSAVSAIGITPAMLETEDPLPVGNPNFFATTIEIKEQEIVLKGPSVFRGYLGGYAGGWFAEGYTNCYRTGDLGYWKDGLLYCKGRKDNQIKYKGYRIELADIEENIRSIPHVEDCIAVPVYTPDGLVKSVKAFIISSDDIDLRNIKSLLSIRLPGYMIPRTIKRLDRFPVNQNGKTDRKALMQL